MICVLHDITIPATDIISNYKSEEKLSFDGKLVVTSSMDIEIDNVNPADYDPLTPGSILYGVDWYDAPVTVYDDDGAEIWSGLAKDIETKPGSLTIRCNDRISALIDTVCVYDSDDDTTPAMHIYNILIGAGLTDDDLIVSSFTTCDAELAANLMYVNCNFTKANNIKCSGVVEELAKIGCMSFIQKNGKIGVEMIEAWDGSIGYQIKASSILKSSVKIKSDKTRLANDYAIKYASGVTISTVTGSDDRSVVKYGTKSFIMPAESVDSITASDYRILIRNSAGAVWLGERHLSLYAYIIYTVSFDMVDMQNKWSWLQVNDIVALYFDSFVNEPARVTALKRDDDKGIISVTVDLLNVPVKVFDRDITPPEKVEIVGAYLTDDGHKVVFEPSTASDLIGYRIYFSCSSGSWESEWCRAGKSPLIVLSPDTDSDGNKYVILKGFDEEATVYFRVKAFDSSLNESEFSDIAVCVGCDTTLLNQYHTTVNNSGYVVISPSNAESGTSPSDFLQYGTKTYAWLTANPTKFQHGPVYESGVYNTGAKSYFTWEATGNVLIQFAESDDTASFPAWTTSIDATATTSRAMTKKYLRFRVIITDSLWTGTSKLRMVSFT